MDDNLLPSSATHNVIISEPHHYYSAQAKTLSARLDDVVLSDEETQRIASEKGVKVIRDAILGSFPVTKVIKTFLDWNEGVSKETKDAKRNYLIERYLNESDENSKAVAQLKALVSDPVGSVIFNKILSILDDNPPDNELFAHLVRTIKHVADSDFSSLFEHHKYAIAQIEQMTPQALSILAAHKAWPPINLPTRSATGSKITSDYNDEFAIAFGRSKGINNPAVIERLKHSISELTTRRFIEAHMHDGGTIRCHVTTVGTIMLPYIADAL